MVLASMHRSTGWSPNSVAWQKSLCNKRSSFHGARHHICLRYRKKDMMVKVCVLWYLCGPRVMALAHQRLVSKRVFAETDPWPAGKRLNLSFAHDYFSPFLFWVYCLFWQQCHMVENPRCHAMIHDDFSVHFLLVSFRPQKV